MRTACLIVCTRSSRRMGATRLSFAFEAALSSVGFTGLKSAVCAAPVLINDISVIALFARFKNFVPADRSGCTRIATCFTLSATGE